MFELQWFPFYYGSLDTNIECTKCGKVRRIFSEWMDSNNVTIKSSLGEIDFQSLKPHKQGYNRVGVIIKNVGFKQLLHHRIMASIFLGYSFDSNFVINHIDGNPSNNNINNLEICSQRQNCSKERSIKRKLPTGVHHYPNLKKKPYKSVIKINGKVYSLGYFETIIDAENAYQNKLKIL